MDPFVQRVLDAYNGNAQSFDQLLTEDVVLVRNNEKVNGREAFKAVLGRVKQAFPDIQYAIDDVVLSGDRVVLRWQARGTHRGEYLGLPATGRVASYTGITIYELRDHKIARAWVSADLLALQRLLRERSGPGASANEPPARVG